MNLLFAYCVALVLLSAHAQNVSLKLSEQEMIERLKSYSDEATGLCNQQVRATWDSATDVGNKKKEEEKVTFSINLFSILIFFL